jgi:hypothetical protein
MDTIRWMRRNGAAVLLISVAGIRPDCVYALQSGSRQSDCGQLAVSHQHQLSLPTQRTGQDLSSPIEHEAWLAIIDNAAVAVRDAKGSVLIAVARLGKGERDRRLNRLRLKYVAEILEGRRFPLRLVVAEGDAVPELGRVEFYVSNELYSVLPYERGKAVAIQHRP